MKHFHILIYIILFISSNSAAQTEPDYREMFLESEMYFLFEEYNEALPSYIRLNQKFPDNDNIKYKIGVCYLNDPYEKAKSISFLEEAVKNTDPKYKENSFKETKAPLEAYFHLGNAYRINNQLDKAIETYEKFKELADPKIYDIELINEQIRACQNAKELKEKPVDIAIVNVGDPINTRFSDMRPVVSGDETKLVYLQKLQFYDAIFFSEKIDSIWSFPRNIMPVPELSVDEDAYPTALSYDGTKLLVYRSDNFIGDLYTSTLVDGLWIPLTKLNDNINTKYWESHACFTKSGDSLYFTSNRKGGYGGLDIYLSIKGEDNQWGIPSNMSSAINTKYNEETPFVTYDGKTLYFSSYGHHNMGGYDVFYSKLLTDGTWSHPVNAGFPINTTDDDVFYVPVQNGMYAYFPRFMDQGYGKTDIYRLEIFTKTHPRKFRIKGIAGIQNLLTLTKPIKVTVIEYFTRDTVAVIYAEMTTGEFSFEAPSGQYDLLITGEEIESTTSQLIVPVEYIQKELDIKSTIVLQQAKHLTVKPEPQIVDKIKLTDTLIMVRSDKPVLISMILEKDAHLIVDTYHDTTYFHTDTIAIDKKKFEYTYTPVPDKNILKLTLIDKEGNISYKNITIIYTIEKPDIEPLELSKDTIIEVQGREIKTQEELKTIITNLYRSSTGELKLVIEELNLEEMDISTDEEFIDYLKDNVGRYDYSLQDIYDMILNSLQNQYLEDYKDQLTRLSKDENMKKALEDMDIINNKIYSLQDIYNYLIIHKDEFKYQTNDINNTFILLSERSEILELINNLTVLSSGNFKTFLEQLDPDKLYFTHPFELMDYLLRNSKRHSYTEKEVINLLLEFIEVQDIEESIKILSGIVTGDLKEILQNLDIETSGIKNFSDLFDYINDQGKDYDFNESDVVVLFMDLVKHVDETGLIDEIEMVEIPEKDRLSLLIYVLIGAACLGIFIVFFLLLRKRQRSEKS